VWAYVVQTSIVALAVAILKQSKIKIYTYLTVAANWNLALRGRYWNNHIIIIIIYMSFSVCQRGYCG